MKSKFKLSQSTWCVVVTILTYLCLAFPFLCFFMALAIESYLPFILSLPIFILGLLIEPYCKKLIIQQLPPSIYICPACGGDGIERCNNPDHGFIYGSGGGNQCGRLGCPCCGHDEYYRMETYSSKTGKYTWNTCWECNGLGVVNPKEVIRILDDWQIDEPIEDFIYNYGNTQN